MKLKNSFSVETRWLFHDTRYRCGDCGGNGQDCAGLELHHIRSRVSKSPLNAIVLCKACHAVVGHTEREESKYMQYTIKELVRMSYKFTEYDIVFYKDNEKLYA